MESPGQSLVSIPSYLYSNTLTLIGYYVNFAKQMRNNNNENKKNRNRNKQHSFHLTSPSFYYKISHSFTTHFALEMSLSIFPKPGISICLFMYIIYIFFLLLLLLAPYNSYNKCLPNSSRNENILFFSFLLNKTL